MIENEHSAMVASLAKPGEKIIETMKPMSTHVLHMAIGMAGEIGELFECVMPKGETVGHTIDMENLVEELGDYHFYFVGFTDAVGFKRKRYPEGGKDLSFDVEKAIFQLAINTMQILDLAKKVVMYNKGFDVMLTSDVEAIVDRISNNLSIIRMHFGLHLHEILNDNICKLTKGKDGKPPRYAAGQYSDKAAQARADKA